MVQTVDVNFKLNTDTPKNTEQICSDMGLTADPFHSDSNIAHLRRGIAALNAGKGAAHELIEIDD